MNFLSKLTLLVSLSTVVCSGFAMDVNVSEATGKVTEFVQENPGTSVLLTTAAAVGTYFAVRWFGSSKAKVTVPTHVEAVPSPFDVPNKPAQQPKAPAARLIGLKKAQANAPKAPVKAVQAPAKKK